jgi:Tfp pilus assembly protein PilF
MYETTLTRAAKSIIFTAVIITTTLLLLTGCNTTPHKQQQQYSAAELKLASGKNNFQNGEYGAAEADFLNSSIWQDSKPLQIESLKYLAFIYCITERVTLCRHSFYKALQLDPNFELTAAESTHPLWGPEFVVAQSGLKGN